MCINLNPNANPNPILNLNPSSTLGFIHIYGVFQEQRMDWVIYTLPDPKLLIKAWFSQKLYVVCT